MLQTIEYQNPKMDKASWGPGAWDNEPDKKQWADPATGLACLIVRNGMGALCGYVGVPKGHPAYGKEYGSVDVDVHGGLTFSDKCSESSSECGGICHVAPEGEDDVWWLGFDCAHYMDLVPSMDAFRRERFPTHERDGFYRDFAYVTQEVTKLASQLAPKQLPAPKIRGKGKNAYPIVDTDFEEIA